MKRNAILPLALLLLSAGAVKSQAPLSGSVASDLEVMVTTNKTLIDTQQKTLDVLDKLDQDAEQVKTFTKRS